MHHKDWCVGTAEFKSILKQIGQGSIKDKMAHEIHEMMVFCYDVTHRGPAGCLIQDTAALMLFPRSLYFPHSWLLSEPAIASEDGAFRRFRMTANVHVNRRNSAWSSLSIAQHHQ